MIPLFLLAAGAVCELLVHMASPHERQLRGMLAIAAIYIVGFTTVLFFLMGGWALWLVAILNVYRIFNLLRVSRHRLSDGYLSRVARRTGLILLVLQISLWLVADISSGLHVRLYYALPAVLALQLILAGVMAAAAIRHANRMRTAADMTPIHDADLPTVTVAIPARNETEDLALCLSSIIASQYPKLEIVVLDDCSQTPRTPEIIRQFAHDGVRFIKGTEPETGWLAKNQAYQSLADDANGEILLFAGVDVRFDPNSIRRLVQYMQSKHKGMLCVMPRNELSGWKLPLIQPMRYVWEVAMPRRALDRPPVLSTCWLITKKALNDAGGFKAVSNMVVPEMYLSRRLLKEDGYSFLASGSNYAVVSSKSIAEQRATAIRTAYPLLHKRPETVALLALAYIAWIALPAAAIIIFAVTRSDIIAFVLALAVCLVNGATYDVVWRLAYGRHSLLASFSLPVATLVYLCLVHYSMYKYEFSEVLWKGRNVCLPVMHVVPHLPPM